MDRRVVVGLVGIALAGVAESCRAQTQSPSRPDPSAQPSVSLAPIPSIGDTINNTTAFGPVVPMASSAVPSSPVGLGPDATVPKAPVPPNPVSMSPIEPIHGSINRGFGTGIFSSMFKRPAQAPAASAVLRARPRLERVSTLDTLAVPSIFAESSSPTSPRPRPAPFAGRAPEAPRAQAEAPAGSSANPETGRPAPFAEERPRVSRPQATTSTTPSYRPAESPAVVPELVAPAVAPAETPPFVPEPSPVPTPAALPAPPAVESSAAPAPPGIDPLAGLDPIPPQTPPVSVAPPAVEVATAPTGSPAQDLPPLPVKVDAEVSRTSQDEVAVKTGSIRPKSLPYATIRAAAVGEEIITINELTTAVTEQLRQMGVGQQPMSESQTYQLKNQVAASVLNGMIDQALVIQQAKRKMKANPKAKQMFDEMADKEWKSQELPPLLRNSASANVYELKVKLNAEGKSYDSMKEAYRKRMLFQTFLNAEIHNKVTTDLIEMKAYYNEHLDKFEQPARMTWREIEINMTQYPSRAAARQKAEDILARLLRDEDFGALAKSSSNGPTSSQGGLYVDMQPGSYGIPVVNDELNRIPTGQVSKILEAPGSFHIIRVDSRREKGPLRFDEVQDKIRGMVLEQNYRRAVDEYLTKLRSKTLIRTMFDNTDSDPQIARRNDPDVQRTSR